MDDFEKELKQGFLEEASQLLSDVEQSFLQFESNPNDPQILEKIFRLAHNLKGSSKAAGFDHMGTFTHRFESLLLKVKKNEIPASKEVIDLLLRGNDHIKMMVDTLKADMEAVIDSTDLMNQMQSHLDGTAVATAPLQESPPEPEEDAFSVESVNQLKELEAEQFLSAPPTPEVAPEVTPEVIQQVIVAKAPEPEVEKAAPSGASAASKTDESIRVSLARLEKLLNFVGEMVILQTVLKEQADTTDSILLRKTVHQIGKVTKEVQDISMSLRMIPIKQTFQKMQRIVRDTSALLNRKVSLVLRGEETELDKTILERVNDPLVHMIRNAVDHGIEPNEVRIANGKPEVGTVSLSAYHQSGKLVIEIKDDGGGIDHERLISKAVEKGILKTGAHLSKKDALHLIFHPGFSMKAQVTEVSGRGVGMDVVKTNIDSLKGEILIDTEVGKGSTFKIILPLTLAIIDAMVVKSGNDRFVVPLSHVHESYKPQNGDIKFNVGLGETLLLRGENMPLYRLSHALGRKASPEGHGIALIIRTESAPFGMLVDDIIGQHQVVIKQLGQELQNLKGFSGSAILGDGRPALILEMFELAQRISSVSSRNDQIGRITA